MKLVTVLGFTISTFRPPYTTGKIKKNLSLVNGLLLFFFKIDIFVIKKKKKVRRTIRFLVIY